MSMMLQAPRRARRARSTLRPQNGAAAARERRTTPVLDTPNDRTRPDTRTDQERTRP